MEFRSVDLTDYLKFMSVNLRDYLSREYMISMLVLSKYYEYLCRIASKEKMGPYPLQEYLAEWKAIEMEGGLRILSDREIMRIYDAAHHK